MRLILTTLALTLMTTPAYAAELDLTAGTMQLGGTVNFRGQVFQPDSEDVDSISGYELTFSPGFGIFVAEGLQILANVGVNVGFGELNENQSNVYSIDGGVRYFFPTSSVVPYVGIQLGFSLVVPKGDGAGDNSEALEIIVPAGALIPLNESVALDLGIRMNYTTFLSGGGSFIDVPFGFLGVRAFFGGDRL